MMEGAITAVPRPEAGSPFEAYILYMFDKVVEKQEIHDTKFDALFYCFGKHEADIETLKKQGKEIIQRLDELKADQKVGEAYYKAVKSRVERLEFAVSI